MSESEARQLQDTLQQRFGHAAIGEVPPNLSDLQTLLEMAARTSTRRFAKRDVPLQLLRLLAATALCAPSKSYLQQADIIEVRSPDQRAQLMALLPDWPWMRDAPAFLVFCGNGSRFRDLFAAAGEPFVNDHLDAFFNSTVDASLVLMNFITAAQAVGLASCPISAIRNRAKEVAALLRLPPLVFPIAGLCVGYPDGREAVKPRLRLDAMLHVDNHAGPQQQDDVREFDGRYVAAQAGKEPGSPATEWSQERLAMYRRVQREDWGAFVRESGFDLR